MSNSLPSELSISSSRSYGDVSSVSYVHDSGFSAVHDSIHAIQHDDQFAINYDSTIKNGLVRFLSSQVKEFFVTVIIVEFGEKNVPAVLIITPPTTPPTLLDQLPDSLAALNDSLWIHADGDFRKLSLPMMSNQRYEDLVSSSWSIGCEEVVQEGEEVNTTGTLGLIFRDGEKYLGLTAGHVVNDQPCEVFSPSIIHFHEYHDELERLLGMLARKEELSRDKYIPKQRRDKQLQELQEVQNALDIVNAVENYWVGSVISKEEQLVTFETRRCLSDFSVLELSSARVYGEDLWIGNYPKSGSLEWLPATQVGDITWDQYVRKTGATSGLTFGVIAGVTAAVQYNDMAQPAEEYYVIQEDRVGRLDFSAKGDSGSAVVTHDGNVVGMLFAECIIDQVRVVLDRNKIVDLPHMKRNRLQDGTVDLDGYVQTRLMGRSFTLVQSMKMIIERGKLANKELVIDL
jgi:Peptidase family S64